MLNVRVKGEAKLLSAIQRLADNISDFTHRWRRNINIRLRRQREWMDTRGRGSWSALTDTYLTRKSSDPSAAFLEILQLTGHLYRSLTTRGAADSVIEEGKSSLTMGTADPKARWHHEGAGRLPVRPVVEIDDAERGEHTEALYQTVTEMIRAEGFRVAR